MISFNFKNFIYALTTVILSVLVSMCGIEGYLRYAYHVPELVAGYYPLGNSISGARINLVQREYTTVINYNNQGFREKNFTPKPDGENRILFLGDSFIEGMGVSDDQRISNLLEQKFKNAHKDRVVINAGQLATNPISYFENLIKFGVALKPNLVIVGVFLGNDFQNSRMSPVPKSYSVNEEYKSNTSLQGKPNLFSFDYLRLFVPDRLNKSNRLVKNENIDNFWQFYFKNKINRNFYIESSGVSYEKFVDYETKLDSNVTNDFYSAKLNPSYFLSSLNSYSGNPVQEYNELDLNNVFSVIKEMHKICSIQGIEFIVVVVPDIYQINPAVYTDHLLNTLKMKEIPKQLLQLKTMRINFLKKLSADKIDTIDLTNVLSIKDYWLFDGHLNNSGNNKAANAIFEVLNK